MSRSVDVDGVYISGREHGDLEIWSYDIPDMLKEALAVGDKTFARAYAHKEGLVSF